MITYSDSFRNSYLDTYLLHNDWRMSMTVTNHNIESFHKRKLYVAPVLRFLRSI